MLSSSGRRTSWRVESNRLPWLGGLRTSTWKGEINQKNTPALSPLAFFLCQGETGRNLGNLFCFRLGAPFPFPRVAWKRGDGGERFPLSRSIIGYRRLYRRNDRVNGATSLYELPFADWNAFDSSDKRRPRCFFFFSEEWKRKRRFNGRNVWLVERERERGEEKNVGSRGEGNCIPFRELERRRRLFHERGLIRAFFVIFLGFSQSLISLGG